MATLFAAQGLLDALQRPLLQAPDVQAMPVTADKSAVVSNYAVVKVYFATDRQRDVGRPPAQRFSGERNIMSDNGPLSYGSCDISIPRDHRMGQLESPSLWRLEFRDDPAKHVVLLDATVHDRDNFLRHSKRRSAPRPARAPLSLCTATT